jgi:hypothetical protein
VVGLGAALALVPALASADDDTQPRPRYTAVDVQGIVMTHLFPHAYFGGDAAFVIGSERFMARFGAQVSGGRAFKLGDGKIGNTLAVASLDACGAKTVQRHRIRLCVGAQGGVMAHRWIGYDRPGRRATPYVAGVLKGDYTISITRAFGLMFGVSVSVPVVGPEFRARDRFGHDSNLVFPGPVTGLISLGAAFRLG